MTFADFIPTDNERALAAYILKFTNSDKLGHMSGDVAVDVFQRTRLAATVLSDIWNIADEDNNGSISEHELTIAIRLMGWAQSGEVITRNLIDKAGPLPKFEGIPEQEQAEPSTSSGFPPITAQDRYVFRRVFLETGPMDGRLDGDKVRDVFLKSNLSFRVLSEIWNLVDSQERGALDITNFALGMYLIQALKTCQISTVPTSIPSEIYEQLSDLATVDISTPSASTSKVPSSPWPSSPAESSRVTREEVLQGFNQTWDVAAEEKQEADKYYNSLDPTRQGYVDGEKAAKFLMKFKLPAEDIARIWDLADINNDNRLTRESFSVAIHLVHQRLSGSELPFVLPPSLLPPSMRPPLTAPIPHVSFTYHDSVSQRRRRGSSPGELLSKSSVPRLRRSKTVLPEYSRYPQWNSNVFDLPEELAETNGISKPTANGSSHKAPISPSADNAFLEELKGETKSLRLQVEQLMKQLVSQNDYREQNENLTKENEELKAQIRDTEQSMSQVLAANQEHDSTREELMEEISRLTSRTESLEYTESELEESSQLLARATQDNENLKARLRDAEAAERNSKETIEGLKNTVNSFQQENNDLKQRVSDMERSLAEPDTRANRRELRVLLKDITHENDSLKQRVRDMEQSMTQMLLVNDNHTRHEQLSRENRHLTLRVQEMEALASQLQSSNEDNVLHGLLQDATKENDRLKSQLRQVQQTITQLRSQHDGRVRELEERLRSLTQENHLLAAQRTSSNRLADHDPAVPPPAYDETMIIL